MALSFSRSSASSTLLAKSGTACEHHEGVTTLWTSQAQTPHLQVVVAAAVCVIIIHVSRQPRQHRQTRQAYSEILASCRSPLKGSFGRELMLLCDKMSVFKFCGLHV